jgi:DNA mismatch endonuclease, patch repair protein
MAAVKAKDSAAELALRSELHRRGRRFRLHPRDLTGRPDLVFRGRKVAVFVDGDFWHGNSWRLRGLPNLEAQFPTRTEWWTTKIRRNMERDAEVSSVLEGSGWHVVRVWESEVLADVSAVADCVEDALRQTSS